MGAPGPHWDIGHTKQALGTCVPTTAKQLGVKCHTGCPCPGTWRCWVLLQGMARPSSILHPGMMPTQGRYSQDGTGLGVGFEGAVGQPSAVLEPAQGGGVASLPLFLPPALGPPGQSGSNRRFLPCRKGCLARHKPPDKGASIAQPVPIWAAPTPALPPWFPTAGTPGPAPPGGASRPGASCSPAAAAGFHKPDECGCSSLPPWLWGSAWGLPWGTQSITAGPEAW